MSEINAFLAMGGYGAYVWPSLGLTFAVLAGLWLASVRDLKRAEAELRALEGPGQDGAPVRE